METELPTSAASACAPRGYCWIPIMELEPGMEIARPVYGGPGLQVTIHLAVGSVITASTIAQLVNKGVECIAVLRNNMPDEAANADVISRYVSRLHEIFGPDPDDNCRPLLDALLLDGP